MRHRVTNNGPYPIRFSDAYGIEHRLLVGRSRIIDGLPIDPDNVGAPDGETEVRYYAQPIFA
jgi:hypothetical protein